MASLAIFAGMPLLLGCGDKDEVVIPPPPSVPSTTHVADWQLDFEENFDGNTLNADAWKPYNSPGHNSNGLRHPSAFTVEDGSLVVTARMCDIVNGKAVIGGQEYNIATGSKTAPDGKSIIVSGGMAHRKEYGPGTKFEFRVRCEKDASNTTSAVILTWPKSGSDRNARCEESDIYETGYTSGSTRDKVSSFFHYGLNPDVNNGKVTQVTKKYDIDATEWHTMGFEWYTDKVYVFLDGNKVWTIIDTAVVPVYEHHLCIQLDAFGLQLADAGSTVKMYVDWVKIYVDKNSVK